MSKTSVVPALFLPLVLAGSGMVYAQDSCQLAREPVLIEGHQSLVFQLGGIPGGGLSLHLSVHGDGRTGGIARITDGTSNTILLAEQRPALSCEDVNLDGFAGLTHLLFALNDVHTGAVVPLVLVPVDGEVDSGLEQMSIALAGRTFVETVNVVSVASVGIGPRLGYRFAVTASAGQVDLGSWSKVSGLDVTVDVIDYRAGGGTITLHRAASSESLLVKAWLQELAQTHERPTLDIALLDVSGEPIAMWTFTEVLPIKWDISGFDANQSGIAIETLVIAYEGVVVDRGRS
jgi:phage tail-like protein